MPIAKKRNSSSKLNQENIRRKPKTLVMKEDTSKLLADYSKTLNKTQSYVIEELIDNYLDQLYDDILEKDMKEIQKKKHNKPAFTGLL